MFYHRDVTLRGKKTNVKMYYEFRQQNNFPKHPVGVCIDQSIHSCLSYNKQLTTQQQCNFDSEKDMFTVMNYVKKFQGFTEES